MDFSYKYFENDQVKIIRSEEFNCFFNKDSGNCVTYGKTIDDDVDFCPFGPTLLDIEISCDCNGVGGSLCEECYKSNAPGGHNMSFEDFKIVFDKLPNTVGQIAFGVSSCATTNKDIWKIFEYCKTNGVIPNLTIADISSDTAKKINEYCGAVAVSCYKGKKEYCYNSIKLLTDLGMNQVNIHFCIHEKTYEFALEVLNDIKTDDRLKKLNAIVFLQLKQKGNGINLTRINNDNFNTLLDKAFENNVSVGFDSCGGHRFKKYCENNNKEHLLQYVTGCESTKESLYINSKCEAFPCSFVEDEYEWDKGIDVKRVNDFIKDVWYNNKIINFRKNITDNCFSQCQYFKV